MFTLQEQEVLDEIDRRFDGIQPKIAFWYLLCSGIADGHFRCIPNKKGFIFEVRLLHEDDTKTHRYSFIANKGSVLWYFRGPAVERFGYRIHRLTNDFGSDKVNTPIQTEITVKIENVENAKTLISNYLR